MMIKNAKIKHAVFALCLLLSLGCLSCKESGVAKSGETCKLTPELESKIKIHLVDQYNIPSGWDIKITSTPSTVPAFDAISVTFSNTQVSGQTQTQEFLLTKDCKNLVFGKVADLNVNPLEEVRKKIALEGSPVMGNKGAKVAIVTYSDFQ